MPLLRIKLPNIRFRTPRIDASGWAGLGAVILLTAFMILNVGRVITNATSNYQVYLYERQSVDVLRTENEQLKRELDYFNSYEYKKLYARDNLRLAEPGETLYQIVRPAKYYDLRERELQLFKEGEMQSWWLKLF